MPMTCAEVDRIAAQAKAGWRRERKAGRSSGPSDADIDAAGARMKRLISKAVDLPRDYLRVAS